MLKMLMLFLCHPSHKNVFVRRIYIQCGYNHVKLTFNKEEHQPLKRTRHRNVIWFNPPFSRNVTTNVAKKFLSLLDKHFPKSNNLHKIFNRNSVKVSYCCTKSLSSIIKSHNKNVINGEISTDPKCNCRKKVIVH